MLTVPLFALHLSDGVLGWPWLAGGFAVAGLLALLACRKMTEDDVPRVALMAAAFFVASSIHVKVGPSSVHLLLTGLVGVVLGWRAPLAILVGITLQALLVAHGGITAVGINAAVQAVPALAIGGLFPLTRDVRRWWARRTLVALGALVLGVCFVAFVGVLGAALGRAFGFRPSGVSVLEVGPLEVWYTFPMVVISLFACVAASQRRAMSPRFAAGAVAGMLGVLGTLTLTGLVLLLDGAEKWGVFVSTVFLAHLPLVVIEALIVGVTVQFLGRVKPEMIGLPPGATPDVPAGIMPAAGHRPEARAHDSPHSQ
jgi:cobalt/nickel transport system permease protein